MPSLPVRRNIAVLALATALAVPWAVDAVPLARPQTASPGLLQQLWTALTGFWGTGVTRDDGCKMDPNGRCATGSAVSPSRPAIILDSGCKMDPNGVCLPGS